MMPYAETQAECEELRKQIRARYQKLAPKAVEVGTVRETFASYVKPLVLDTDTIRCKTQRLARDLSFGSWPTSAGCLTTPQYALPHLP